MADIEVQGKITVDTGSSAADINRVRNSLRQTGNDTVQVVDKFQKLKDALGAIPGPAGNVMSSFLNLKEAFKVIAANPLIGVLALLINMLSALWDRMKKMSGVSDAMGKAFGQLGAVMNWLMNNIVKPLIEAFTTLLSWIGDAAEWIGGLFSDSAAEAAKRTGELADQMKELEKAEEAAAISRAEGNLKLEETKRLAEQVNRPVKERIALLEESGRVEQVETNKAIELARQRAAIMLEELALEVDARDELIQKIRQGTYEQLKAAREELLAMKNVDKEKIKGATENLIKMAELNSESQAKMTENETKIQDLRQQEKDKAEAAQKEREDKAKAAAQKAAADRRERLANQRAFDDKARRQREELQLNGIKDARAKELRVLQLALEAETRANQLAMQENKISRAQFNELQLNQLNLFKQKEAEVYKKYIQLEAEQEKAAADERARLQAERAAQDAKAAAEQRQAERDLRQRRMEFDIAQAAGDLALTKKLLDDKAALLYQYYQSDLLAAGGNLMLRKQLEQKYTEDTAAMAAARQQIADAEMAHKAAVVTETTAIVGKAAEIFGKQTVAAKVLGVGQALINTFVGATDALRAKSALPSPFDVVAKVVNVAAVLKTGFEAVRNITRVQVPGGGGGGVSVPAIAASTPIGPLQQSTQLDAGSIQGIGNAAGGGVNRTFVLDSDITNNAERAARLNRAARLE